MADEKLVAIVTVVVGLCSLSVKGVPLNTGTCEDTIDCKRYAYDVCQDPQYYQWAITHCRKYCGLCPGSNTDQFSGVGKYLDEAPQNKTSQCHDNISNCAIYGTEICTDIRFFHWVRENCISHCGLCDNMCEDKIPNCADYGAEVCTNLAYYNWVHMHCRKYCSRCTSS